MIHDGNHAYLSTACLHEQAATTETEQKRFRSSCRFFCKFCPAPCQCPCHEGSTEPYPGYDADTEARLRIDLREAIRAAGIEPVPRRVETLVDIVTAVLHEIAKDKA